MNNKENKLENTERKMQDLIPHLNDYKEKYKSIVYQASEMEKVRQKLSKYIDNSNTNHTKEINFNKYYNYQKNTHEAKRCLQNIVSGQTKINRYLRANLN